MLSITYSVIDAKKELQTYDVYGYETDDLFDDAIEYAFEQAAMNRMYPIMGIADYDYIATLDKGACNDAQLYIYWADVWYALGEFLLLRSRHEQYNRKGNSESRSQGGISASISGSSGKEKIASEYFQTGDRYMAMYGYDTQCKLVR